MSITADIIALSSGSINFFDRLHSVHVQSGIISYMINGLSPTLRIEKSCYIMVPFFTSPTFRVGEEMITSVRGSFSFISSDSCLYVAFVD